MQVLMKRIENILYLSLGLIVIALYFVHDLAIDLYQYRSSGTTKWTIGILSATFMFRLFYRFGRGPDWKWFAKAFNFILFSGLLFMVLYSTFIKADILGSALYRNSTEQTISVREVRKHIASRGGFVGSYITVDIEGKEIEMDADRVHYFLLKDKKSLNVNLGRSFTGSYYITHIQLPESDWETARDQYRCDWLRRHWIWIVLILAVIVIAIVTNRNDRLAIRHPSPLTPKRLLKLTMLFFLLTFALLLLWILGMIVYSRLSGT